MSMTALKANAVPLMALAVLGVLLWGGKITWEQAAALMAAAALPGLQLPGKTGKK